MDYLISNLLVQVPKGMWESIIIAFEGAFGSFALSIILLTICIKLVMSPIDYFNRRTNKKMADMQKRIQPQMEAINKKYANDAKMRNQKLGELYQKEKINPIGSCSIMLISMVLTLLIFITLFNGMNAMASYKIADQYEKLQIAYVTEFAGDRLDLNQEGKTVYEICIPFIEEMNAIEDETTKNEVIIAANQNVVEVYKQTKQGFLWIENIWLADSPLKNSIPSYEEYATVARLSEEDRKNEEYAQVYNQIMEPLKTTQGRVNGYFILVVLCAGVSFLNQWFMMRKMKKEGTRQSSGIVMLIVMPIIMLLFAFMYTTMFTLYMITGQIVSLITMPLINKIGDAVDKRKENKKIPTDRLKRI